MTNRMIAFCKRCRVLYSHFHLTFYRYILCRFFTRQLHFLPDCLSFRGDYPRSNASVEFLENRHFTRLDVKVETQDLSLRFDILQTSSFTDIERLTDSLRSKQA